MAVIDSFSGKYWFLSNFYPCEIVYDGINYPTIEHAYQAAKTLDKVTRLRIAALDRPDQAKKIGKTIELRDDWEEVKVCVMYDLLKLKFSQDKFRKLLLETGDNQLIEGNTWGDQFWGVASGIGLNALGKLLMKVREDLK